MADPIEGQPPVAASPAPATETAAPANADQVIATAPAEVSSLPAGAEAASAAPNAEAAPVVPETEPTLLEKHDAETKAKTEEVKPPEAVKPPEGEKPAEEVKAEEVKPPEVVPEPLAPIDYFASLTIPETLKIDDAMKGDVVKAFDGFRANPTEGAQGLIDLHNKVVTDVAEQIRKDQWKTFNDTRKAWQTEVMADPKLGGAGYNTAMGAVARMRDLFVSDAKPGTEQYQKDSKELETFLRVTGAGDHPAFLKLLHNAARYFDEPPLPPPGARPAPNNGKPPRRGVSALYDHPTSTK